MDILLAFWHFFIELLTNTEVVLDTLVDNYGVWVYAILFLIIFCETGLVVTPFLPGDSLLFLVGTIAHRETNDLNVVVLMLVLIVAAILGDAVNYMIGKYFGEKLFSNPDSKIFKQGYLDKTNLFYEKHGGKTIILARFVPIVRTFAPFVAGMSRMHYSRFLSFNVIGGVAWIVIFIMLGYLVGGIDVVQNNLKLVMIGIVIISLLPGVYEFLRMKLSSNTKV